VLAAGFYGLERAMRAAMTVEDRPGGVGPLTTPAELAWYHRPADVFLRQVIHARAQRGIWRE
jgi:hypothetical protein